jgi:hypothetical protein
VAPATPIGRAARLAERIEALRPEAAAGGVQARRRYASALREAAHLYEDGVRNGRRRRPLGEDELAVLRQLASAAFAELGGEPEPPAKSLRDYDSERFGPYLGVSGDESAAPAIREAALTSPKVLALGLTDPLEIGVAHDAERLGSIGELPVGPDEYREIRLEGTGRILTSTNVGSRMNVRHYGRIPVLWVNPAGREAMLKSVIGAAQKRLAPFLHTPDGEPRAATIHVQFRSRVLDSDRRTVLRRLLAEIRKGKMASPEHHTLALVAKVGRGDRGVAEAIDAVQLAHSAGVDEVAIDGVIRSASADVISNPGLLQYFNSAQLNRLLAASTRNGVRVKPKSLVDAESVARQVWPALHAARAMGLALGKYGLLPLTLAESEEVIQAVQCWFMSWTAAPVFYIDMPVVLPDTVVPTRQVTRGAKLWLDMVARHDVPVVLIDTVLKSESRRLLRTEPRDSRGFLSASGIQALDRYARGQGVHALWAGGISIAQAYEFGRLGVFGLYVTTAVATTRPVGPAYRRDPALAAERMPTTEGVSQVKLLIEAGFMASRLPRLGFGAEGRRIHEMAREILSHEPKDVASLAELRDAVVMGWRTYARLSTLV